MSRAARLARAAARAVEGKVNPRAAKRRALARELDDIDQRVYRAEADLADIEHARRQQQARGRWS